MRCEICKRCCGYLFYFVCSTLLCEGLFHKPSSGESKRYGDVSNSSPSLHNSSVPVYSSWSMWSSCSVTCGTGISSRTRTCLKSAYNSRGVYVHLCHGEYSEHKICNLKGCTANSDAREFQCSQYNNQIIAGKLVKTWVPAYGGPNPCELRCESRSDQLVYGFGKASDGTPCPHGICLDGRCLRLGCDSRLGSGVAADMCGVCGGGNSSCVHYKDVYEGQLSAGSGSRSSYYEVVVIPYGARNLIIRQPLGKNILALQDRSKGIIFNGEQDDSKYGEHYEISGSVVSYRKLDVLAEQLLAKGPITQELKVLVLLRSRNPGIYYEYWLPKQSHNPGRSHYPLLTPSLPILTTPSPRIGQSFTVPFYKSLPTAPTYVPNHHPTKPPFAYGFGDKPQEGQKSPIFRQIRYTSSTPGHEKKYDPVTERSKRSTHSPKIHPPFKRGVFKPKPVEDYYATYRNASRSLGASHQAEAPSIADDITQGDSSSSNGGNTISNKVVEEKKRKVTLSKHPKPIAIEIPISKRTDLNKVSNGRLKYSFEGKDTDEVYVNSSGRYTPEPISINVLPDSGKSRQHVSKKNDEVQQKPRLTRGGICEPCQRSRNQLKHFCESDFVVHALVIDFEFVAGETRYELEVNQSFKNTLPLLPKEYVWSPDTCRCPKLRPGKDYIVMGRTDNSYRKRESRLLVDRASFVRTFSPKHARRLQKLRKEHQKKCRKFS